MDTKSPPNPVAAVHYRVHEHTSCGLFIDGDIESVTDDRAATTCGKCMVSIADLGEEFDDICVGWLRTATWLFGPDAPHALRKLKSRGRGGSGDWPGREAAYNDLVKSMASRRVDVIKAAVERAIAAKRARA